MELAARTVVWTDANGKPIEGLFGGLTYAENNIEISDNSATTFYGYHLCELQAKKMTFNALRSMSGEYVVGCSSSRRDYECLEEFNAPNLTNLTGRTFFYRSKLKKVNLPSVTSRSGVYHFYNCSALRDVTMTSYPSSSAFATIGTSGGFPWDAPTSCVFHFSDGDAKYINGAWTLVSRE